MQAYFRMPFIATLLNACNANDDVHNRIVIETSYYRCTWIDKQEVRILTIYSRI